MGLAMPKRTANMQPITIYVSKKALAKIKQIAREKGLTYSEIIRRGMDMVIEKERKK